MPYPSQIGVEACNASDIRAPCTREIYTAAMQSTSISKCPGNAGTQTKMRAGGSFGSSMRR